MVFSPIIESTTTSTAGFSESLELTLPIQPQPGWLLVASLRVVSTSRNWIELDGWNIVREFSDDTDDVVLAWRFAETDEPSTTTWTTAPDNGGSKTGCLVAYSGVPSSVPSPGFSVTGLTSSVSQVSVGPTSPPPSDNALAIAAFGAETSLGSSTSSDDLTDGFGNWDVYDASSVGVSHKVVTDGSAQQVSTQHLTQDASRGGAVLVLFSEDTETQPDPEKLKLAWHGAVTDTAFSVVAEPDSNSDVTLVISEQSDYTSPVFDQTLTGSVGAPVRFDVSGLSANTNYFWVASTNDDAIEGSVKTFPSGASNISIAFGSCAGNSGAEHDINDNNTSNAPTFARIKDRSPDLFIHMGDFHYQDIESESIEPHRAGIRDVLDNLNQAELYRAIPLAYIHDDHEWGPNDSNAESLGRDQFLEVYRDYVPHYPLADTSSQTAPIYFDFTIGRLRVVMLDVRSERRPEQSEIIGTAQMAWLKGVLDSVESQGQGLILASIVPWIDSSGADTWASASAERAEIADAIHSRGLSGRTIIIAGDMHALAADDGTNNTYTSGWSPGPAVLQAAPFDTSNSTKGGPYSEGTVTDSRQQYGVLELSDTGGDDVAWTFRGLSVDGESETETLNLSGQMSLPDLTAFAGISETTVTQADGSPLASTSVTRTVTLAGDQIFTGSVTTNDQGVLPTLDLSETVVQVDDVLVDRIELTGTAPHMSAIEFTVAAEDIGGA